MSLSNSPTEASILCLRSHNNLVVSSPWTLCPSFSSLSLSTCRQSESLLLNSDLQLINSFCYLLHFTLASSFGLFSNLFNHKSHNDTFKTKRTCLRRMDIIFSVFYWVIRKAYWIKKIGEVLISTSHYHFVKGSKFSHHMQWMFFSNDLKRCV